MKSGLNTRSRKNMSMRLHTIKQAHGHGDAAMADIQTRLDRKDAINNLEAETRQVMITVANPSSQTRWRRLTTPTPQRSLERCRSHHRCRAPTTWSAPSQSSSCPASHGWPPTSTDDQPISSVTTARPTL